MLSTAFSLKLEQQVLPNLVVIGKFDGTLPTLVCATNGGKILLYSPHEGSKPREAQLPTTRYLNFSKNITSLAAGQIDDEALLEGSTTQILFIGTENSLLAYDVEKNSEVFFKEVPDGVNAIVTGKLSSTDESVVVAGGNCSVLGFNKSGDEVYWTVTGDNISAIEFCDIDDDRTTELIVGSDDFEIRIFKGEELTNEITESSKVIFLKAISNTTRFAYGLSNGTVGVYDFNQRSTEKGEQKFRRWRQKSNVEITSMAVLTVVSGLPPLLACGHKDGSVELRSCDKGTLLFKDVLDSPIASILQYDLRLDGKQSMIVVAESGEVRGYLQSEYSDINTSGIISNLNTNMSINQTGDHKDNDKAVIEQLQATKAGLTNELKTLETKLSSSDNGSSAIPATVELTLRLEPSIESNSVLLSVDASGDLSISSLVAIDIEGAVVEGAEVLAISPPTIGRAASLPLRPFKYQASTIRVQSHVGSRVGSGGQLGVFEVDMHVPAFAAFKQLASRNDCLSLPTSELTFKINVSTERLADWMKNVFLLTFPIKFNGEKLQSYFMSAIKIKSTKSDDEYNEPLHILAQIIGGRDGDDDSASLRRGDSGDVDRCLTVKMRCDRMELAGELTQNLCSHFKLTKLDSTAEFPHEFEYFEKTLNNVTERDSLRTQVMVDTADEATKIKALIVRAEDSRLMRDMPSMRRAYTELYSTNNSLIGGSRGRAANHASLLENLKDVNKIIQRASNLRYGPSKTNLITASRAALKSKNMKSLLRILTQGYE